MAGLKTPGVAPDRSTLIVRMTPDEYLVMAEAAAADGRSIASFVRYAVRELARRVLDEQVPA